MSDNVNHPKHYNSHPSGVECIQITEHLSFNIGNAVKYLWRTEHKNGKEDLEKAIWYIQREIKRLYPFSYEDVAKDVFGKNGFVRVDSVCAHGERTFTKEDEAG